MMEYFNTGIMGEKKNKKLVLLYPIFHYSILPLFQFFIGGE
jgi:hypothetical protein